MDRLFRHLHDDEEPGRIKGVLARLVDDPDEPARRRDTAAMFARAHGDLGLPIVAGKVNTLQGWRDVKVGVVARREPGKPITPSE